MDGEGWGVPRECAFRSNAPGADAEAPRQRTPGGLAPSLFILPSAALAAGAGPAYLSPTPGRADFPAKLRIATANRLRLCRNWLQPTDVPLSAASEPIFNVPKVVTAMLAVLVLVHVVRELVLSPEQDLDFLLMFAFLPARYDPTLLSAGPGGLAADVWTFVTYALIHGVVTHLAINGVWLLAFGTPLARRFGSLRFLAFFALTAAAGAAAHLASHAGEAVPMIGASASVSGFMAASMRFAFQRGGPLGLLRRADDAAYRVPALPLLAALRDARVLVFLIAWFALNVMFAFTSLPILGVGQVVAWQAHIGGFLAGLFAFAAFDPIRAGAADAEARSH